MPKIVDHPIILGVVGDSATGKTTLSAGVAKILGHERCTVICSDDYHAYDRKQRKENGISALDPRGNYIDILGNDLRALRRGESILKPIYNHSGGTLDRPEYVKPRDFVIIEGLLGYASREMRDCYDVKIYLDPEEELRIKWKVHRDTTQRGYTEPQVLDSLAKRVDDSKNFIQPQRTFADIVINFQTPEEGGDDAHLDVRHILRPTLPHPDFSPLFESANNNGLHLELARDVDGKPVDVLEIDGTIPDDHAAKIQNLLWDLIPEASHLRAQLGQVDGASTISHPLALTQLLVAYHMVKAALGVHAV